MTCMDKVSKNPQNREAIDESIKWMEISIVLFLLSLRVNPIEAFLIYIMAIQYTQTWRSTANLQKYITYNLLLVMYMQSRANRLQRAGMVAIFIGLAIISVYELKQLPFPNPTKYDYKYFVKWHSEYFELGVSLFLSAAAFILSIRHNWKNTTSRIPSKIIFVLLPVVTIVQLIKLYKKDNPQTIISANYMIVYALASCFVLRLVSWFRSVRKQEGVGDLFKIRQIEVVIYLLTTLSIFGDYKYWFIVGAYVGIARYCL